MRHKVFGNQLGRNTKQARALYRGLTRDLLLHGRIETTLAKAKAVVPMVDHVITLAKKNSIAARREVTKMLGTDKSLDKIFGEVAPSFSNRNSGYTRIIRLGERFSDQAKLVVLELIETPKPETKTTKPKPTKKVAKTKK